MAVIPVELGGRSYEVRVGSGLLADVANQCGPGWLVTWTGASA